MGSPLCPNESPRHAPLRIIRVSMSRVSKLSLRRDTLTIRYLGCWLDARVSDLSGSWARTICGVFTAGKSGERLPSRCLSLSSIVWAQAFMRPPVLRGTPWPGGVSRNRPSPPCPTEKRPCGHSSTASNRPCRPPRFAPCAVENALPVEHAARGRANPRTPNQVVIGVETRARSAKSLRGPTSAGVERDERDSYVLLGSRFEPGVSATYRKDQKP